mmetsp:Transcript_49460/g.59893  ORF Transcript_49460/g.59893 Transcript_49460/m.59893 type:complete len:599 (-) Transcript_49460:50-1846(-)
MKQPPNSAFETKTTIYENDQTLKSNSALQIMESGIFDFVDILRPDYCNDDDGSDVVCDQLVCPVERRAARSRRCMTGRCKTAFAYALATCCLVGFFILFVVVTGARTLSWGGGAGGQGAATDDDAVVTLAAASPLTTAGATATGGIRHNNTVILIGVPGSLFRYDTLHPLYEWDQGTSPPKTPHLKKWLSSRDAVHVERLEPVFPTLSLPNWYSIVTGLYTESHGIVADEFYDGDVWCDDEVMAGGGAGGVAERCGCSGGEPVWVTARKNNKTSFVSFWPGSNAAVKGVRPNMYHPTIDNTVPLNQRVEAVLDALDLKAFDFIALQLSLSGEDHLGKMRQRNPSPYGNVTARGIERVDDALGSLMTGIEERYGDEDETMPNVILVSDHGTAATTKTDKVIYLEDYLDLTAVRIGLSSPVIHVWPLPEENATEAVATVYENLMKASKFLHVWKKENVPSRFHYSHSDRIAPVLAVAKQWSMVALKRGDGNDQRHLKKKHKAKGSSEKKHKAKDSSDGGVGGVWGYENELQPMQAFMAVKGPAFRGNDGNGVKSLKSVDIYKLLCFLMGIEAAPNDGTEKAILRLIGKDVVAQDEYSFRV